MTTEEIKKEIKLITRDSWFDLDSEDGNMMIYSSRRFGDAREEVPGVEDLREALRVRYELCKKVDNIAVDIEDVDEWVLINIKLIPN